MQKTAVKVTEAAFTCYPVRDMSRARSFYESVFNLTLETSYDLGENSWAEYDLNGTTFTLGYMLDGPQPTTSGAMIAFEVADFDETVGALKAAGAKFSMEPFETPGCRMAMVEDSEGNALMIHQLKKTEG